MSSSNTFDKFRKKIKKEAIDDPGAVDMGVSGTLNGATNKEPIGSNKGNLIGFDIKKKKKFKEDHVKELEDGLHKLTSHSYGSIDKLMQGIAKKNNISGEDLHNDFKNKYKKTPDDWIKDKK